MKKIFYLIFFALSFISCDCTMNTNVKNVGNICTDSLYITVGIQSIIHFEYNGHKYIDFKDQSGAGAYNGNVIVHSIVHDPDCPCFNK